MSPVGCETVSISFARWLEEFQLPILISSLIRKLSVNQNELDYKITFK